MITSFFGRHSFGGDSVYVERLCEALIRLGHEVHIAFSSGAFDMVRAGRPERHYEPPPQLRIHDIGPGVRGRMAALWNHQTGGLGLALQPLGALLNDHTFDLIHLHNVSLLGGGSLPLFLKCQKRAVKFVTTHDYWWICPQSLFLKNGCSVCESSSCITCALMCHRPPQLWRRKGWFNKTLSHIDAVLFPSRFAMDLYESRGLAHPSRHVMPGLLTADWAPAPDGRGESAGDGSRPYFAAAGRLVIEKGFQTVIPLMRKFPGIDLRLAGTGPAEGVLRKLARGLPNVRFEGLLNHGQIRRLFRGARAVIVPSIFPETFGMVAAEAMSLGVPVIARNQGSLPELLNAASGGLLFDRQNQLIEHMGRFQSEDDPGFGNLMTDGTQIPSFWLERAHVQAYLRLYETMGGKGAQT